ncbi:GNAT family N-acetyltransferase [Terrisporobacter petrolearius]|uniref:GNAT family N-acetyltransferase n=1 Tax=Terrisporobacter petrolearius TaxID=1460447 RepID=UPI001D161D35|nr:GNAT family N-acetyltransferase [Terrisporobacter petrolearius]MCC3864375.1 GNAT family N-acetyltransferase [Terrisporobacter petrolearius]
MKKREIQIKLAYDEIDSIKELFTEYKNMLVETYKDVEGVSSCFVSFQEELDTLQDKYALPKGRLYIAKYDGKIAGCAGLRSLDNHCCEVKRLYVRNEFRSLGIGKLLMEYVIKAGKELDYDLIVLDTFSHLERALDLYYKLGFKEIKEYYNSPIKDVIYLGLDLNNKAK